MSVRSERRERRYNFISSAVLFSFTFLVIIMFFHFIRFPKVDGSSMEPSFHDRDTLVMLYTNSLYTIKNDDVVVLWSDTLGEYIIKRVVGVPGDRIEIKEGQVYRNGVRLYETYLNSHLWAEVMDAVDVTVPDGHVYVMGDNRDDSTDSRVIGFIEIKCVFGKVLFAV